MRSGITGRSLVIAAVLLLAVGIGCRSEQPVDYASLVDNLRQAGATVEPAGDITQPFFSVSGRVIRVDGEDVQVFEYADSTEAGTETKLVSPDGNSIGTQMVSWVAPPHFYTAGKLIVLYVGDTQAVTDALDEVLGAQFAGRQQ